MAFTAQDVKIVEAMMDTFLRKDYAGLETAEVVTDNVPIIINDNVIIGYSNTDDLLNQKRAQISNSGAEHYKNLNYNINFKINQFSADKASYDGIWFKFLDFVGENPPAAAEGLGLILRRTNCLFGYITETTFDYHTLGQDVKTFNLPLNTTDEFNMKVVIEDNILKATVVNLTTGRKICEATYPLTAETCELKPSLAVGFRFTKAEVVYNIFSDEYVDLASEDDLDNVLVEAKEYTDEVAQGFATQEDIKETQDMIIGMADFQVAEELRYTGALEDVSLVDLGSVYRSQIIHDINVNSQIQLIKADTYEIVGDTEYFGEILSNGDFNIYHVSYGGGVQVKELGVSGNIDFSTAVLTITTVTVNAPQHLHIDSIFTNAIELGQENIVPGSVEIYSNETMAPIKDSGDSVLYKVDTGHENIKINYKITIN